MSHQFYIYNISYIQQESKTAVHIWTMRDDELKYKTKYLDVNV